MENNKEKEIEVRKKSIETETERIAMLERRKSEIEQQIQMLDVI